MRVVVVEGFICARKSRRRYAIRSIMRCRCIAISVCAAHERSGSIQREPPGRRRAPRVKGLAGMVYLLGVGYGAGSFALEGVGGALCKSRVDDWGERGASPGARPGRGQGVAAGKKPPLGGGLASA